MGKTANYKKLEEHFPGKILAKFITAAKPCPLDYRELLTFSTLLFRARKRGATVRQLGRMTRLDRNKTLPKVLKHLSQLELAEARGRRWFALEPSDAHEEWFRTINFGSETPLDAQFAYSRFVMPVSDAPISILDSAIMVADYLTPHLRNGLLAARFRKSKRTIIRSRNKIRNLGTPHLSWFADRSQPSALTEDFARLRPPFRDQGCRETEKAKTESRPRRKRQSPEDRAQEILRALRLPELCRSPLLAVIKKMTMYDIKPENQYGIFSALKRKVGKNDDRMMELLWGLLDKVDNLMRDHRQNSFESLKHFGDGSGLIFKWISSLKL